MNNTCCLKSNYFDKIYTLYCAKSCCYWRLDQYFFLLYGEWKDFWQKSHSGCTNRKDIHHVVWMYQRFLLHNKLGELFPFPFLTVLQFYTYNKLFLLFLLCFCFVECVCVCDFVTFLRVFFVFAFNYLCFLCVYICACLLCLSVCLPFSVCLSTWLSAWFVCLSVCLPACLSHSVYHLFQCLLVFLCLYQCLLVSLHLFWSSLVSHNVYWSFCLSPTHSLKKKGSFWQHDMNTYPTMLCIEEVFKHSYISSNPSI